jgi:hypothetical protein
MSGKSNRVVLAAHAETAGCMVQPAVSVELCFRRAVFPWSFVFGGASFRTCQAFSGVAGAVGACTRAATWV